MRKTLYIKFLIAYVIFAFFGFIIVSTFVSGMIEDHLVKENAQKLYQGATMISNTYAADLYGSRISLETAERELQALDSFISANIWIINPSGLIVLDTSTPLDVETPTVIEGFDPTITAGSYYITGKFFDSFTEDHLSVFAPIVSNFKVQGYVVIHYPISEIQNSAYALLNISYVMLIILFLLSLIILLFFTELVYIPLKKIISAIDEYASGNMHYEFQVETGDEIGYLAASLNAMAGEQARMEDNQKKFIANVSHDFRSPLTSIRGYIKAMLDGTIPEDMYHKYLNTVLQETERLTKLTNSLLTLNNLNFKDIMPDMTDFNINNTIRTSCEAFEGICSDKNIKMNLTLYGEDLMVHADESKIQQVLYNLLDNALKFSNTGDSIDIETTEKGNKVFVSVKDHGIGIPKEDLKFIWDRFYKSDLSRGKDKKGTGLGLSITKEIINAHNEHINVVSTVDVGTEFIFSLTLSEDTNEEI